MTPGQSIRTLRAELENADRHRQQTRTAARTARRYHRRVRRLHLRAVLRPWLRCRARQIHVVLMGGFATCALVFFALGVNLYFTGQLGSGDCFKGAGAAAAVTTMLRRPTESEAARRASGSCRRRLGRRRSSACGTE